MIGGTYAVVLGDASLAEEALGVESLDVVSLDADPRSPKPTRTSAAAPSASSDLRVRRAVGTVRVMKAPSVGPGRGPRLVPF
ncbi:hypothetical protein GCM10009858_36290 [Terrabacter carboxydivorans]|uniref:Uncharacterized protein n=1 Tax=Terrabacter carboxydivorans TaxID=619730 RepID=A0ABN3M2X3_9MICO